MCPQIKNRILIVDDSPLNRALLHDTLCADYELELAADGEQCLELLGQFAPDVVLLDIMMPGIDGYEVCRRIKSSPYGDFTQVILVSARKSTGSRLEGYQSLADDYITKPFNTEELCWKLRAQFRLREANVKLWQANNKIRQYSEQLEDLVAQRTREVVQTQDVAVFALAQLAESRDPETGEHLIRMRSYSCLLAEELSHHGPYVDQIDKDFLTTLYRSAPLHDIGKVGVPDAILLKPGKLTFDEFAAMKQHVAIGAETLERAARHAGGGQFLVMAAEIARYHHEWFDGGGYLAGIRGDEIPLSARIVAVADVYDALTSKRVYKEGFEPELARNIIDERCGVQFDPAVVDAFHARYDEFLQVPASAERHQMAAGCAV